MKQESSITRGMAAAQEAHAQRYHKTVTGEPCDKTGNILWAKSVLYSLYTEAKPTLPELVSRYFDGATFYYGVGLWQGKIETSCVIEILGTPADLQKIVNLAGDIKTVNAQSSVLVTWTNASRLDV